MVFEFRKHLYGFKLENLKHLHSFDQNNICKVLNLAFFRTKTIQFLNLDMKL